MISEARRIHDSRMRFRRRRKGLCVKCGRVRNPGSKSYCDEHLNFWRDRARRKRGYAGGFGRPEIQRIGVSI